MSVSVLSSVENKVYFRVRLRLKLRDRILAGIPANDDILDWFMEKRHMSEEAKAEFKARVEGGLLTEDEQEEIKETSKCVFERDRDGDLCVWHGNFKAMLREIFVTLGITQKAPKRRGKGKDGEEDKSGAAGGRQTMQHGIHVDPLRVKFMRDGKTIKVADGAIDKVKHITDASGKRSAIGRHEYVDQPEMVVEFKWPADGVIDEDDMKKALAVCQDDGVGACRSQGFGKFDVVEWTVLNAPKKEKNKQELAELAG